MSGCLTERTFSFGPLPARRESAAAGRAPRRLRPASIVRKPSPVLMPSLPALTLSAGTRCGPVVRSRSAYSTSAISSVRSSPTRSDCSIGPSTAMRAPKPSFTTLSMVSASQTPAATSAMASRFIACCSRLPTKPGMSFARAPALCRRRAAASMVRRTTRRWSFRSG